MPVILVIFVFCLSLRNVAAEETWSSPYINFDEIDRGTSHLYLLPGRKCSDDTEYAFIVTHGEDARPNENGNYEKVMVSFMAGGACFDFPSCMGQIPGADYNKNVVDTDVLGELLGMDLERVVWTSKMGFIKAEETDCMVSTAGLLPCSSSEFSDYVSLLVPYCTGDLHFGTQTATYYQNEETESGESVTINHHGALNFLDILPAFIAATGSPNDVKDLIVAGGSAGGWGAFIWGGPIMEAFESTSAESSRGKLRTNVLVDSAFQAPPDDPAILTKMFSALKWGPSSVTWRDKLNPVQPGNFVSILKEALQHYGGRFRVAFLACDNDAVDDGFASYVFPLTGVDTEPSRVARLWKFLGDIHQYDSTLGSTSDGSDSRVFSFIADCSQHYLTYDRAYQKYPLQGNERAPKLADWVDTFLTTGFPYKVSSDTVRVGGPSYTKYLPQDAGALATLKADKNADKYWCCVRDLDQPGTTFQDDNYVVVYPDSYSACVFVMGRRSECPSGHH